MGILNLTIHNVMPIYLCCELRAAHSMSPQSHCTTVHPCRRRVATLLRKPCWGPTSKICCLTINIIISPVQILPSVLFHLTPYVPPRSERFVRFESNGGEQETGLGRGT